MYIPWDALARRDVVNTAATVMVLPALSSLMKLVSVTLASILQVVVMLSEYVMIVMANELWLMQQHL